MQLKVSVIFSFSAPGKVSGEPLHHEIDASCWRPDTPFTFVHDIFHPLKSQIRPGLIVSSDSSAVTFCCPTSVVSLDRVVINAEAVTLWWILQVFQGCNQNSPGMGRDVEATPSPPIPFHPAPRGSLVSAYSARFFFFHNHSLTLYSQDS